MTGVDLLVHLHGADERRKGRAHPAGHDDADHDGAHDAQHAYADEAGHVDLGAEHAQLHCADEGEDEAEEQARQADDGQRAHAALVHGLHEIVELHG